MGKYKAEMALMNMYDQWGDTPLKAAVKNG
jgi:ankyrin repeat protein